MFRWWLLPLLLWATLSPAAPLLSRFRPVRRVQHPCRILADVCSHADLDYRDKRYQIDSLLTIVHETSHRAAGTAHLHFCNVHKRHVEAVYCLDDQAMVFTQPLTVSMTQVAAAVPVELRGRIFPLYLQRHHPEWERYPTYLLNEWTAYTHECLAARELGLTVNSDIHRSAAELLVYSAVLAELEPKNTEIPAYIHWNAGRLLPLLHGERRTAEYLQRLKTPAQQLFRERLQRLVAPAVLP